MLSPLSLLLRLPRHKTVRVVLKETSQTNRKLLDRVGVFATLTNSYALVSLGASENFYRFVFLFPALLACVGGCMLDIAINIC